MPNRSKMIYLFFAIVWFLACNETDSTNSDQANPNFQDLKIDFSEQDIIARADIFLNQKPVPITSFSSERSEGGIHDFYSEGDYWWPNPDDPDGPYIRRDGKTNPENFTAHRRAMRNLNEWVSALVAAYKITGEEKYAAHALKHLNAFFIDSETLMNPSLLYAQAIKGKVSGRGIGLIDTIHLIEITQAVEEMIARGYLSTEDAKGLKQWFNDFATWMNTHEYGLKEKDHGNNHSTWWAAQMAAFSKFAEREDLLEVSRSQFKKLLPLQMASDGSFPDEMERTKPYNYTLFNLEGYAVLCKVASTEDENLWLYEGETGSLQKAWNFMLPFVKDKSTWIKPPDVQHFDELPIQSPGLLFAAMAYEDADYLQTWQKLSPERESEEIKRTYPLWEPSLWVD